MRHTLNDIPQRTKISVFAFTDEDNQVIYTCICAGYEWAKELFLNQFPNTLEAENRWKQTKVYWAELTGNHFQSIIKPTN